MSARDAALPGCGKLAARRADGGELALMLLLRPTPPIMPHMVPLRASGKN